LNADGTPDETFGPGGKVVSNLNGGTGTHYLNRILLLPDGRILGAGYDFASNGGDFFLVRYGSAPTDAGFDAALQGSVALRAFPNPSRGETVVQLQLRNANPVRVGIYDIAGRVVHRLFQGGLGAGAHAFEWDGRDATGRAVAAGTYFARIEIPGTVRSHKLVMLKR
jgi:hypothetical protein